MTREAASKHSACARTNDLVVVLFVGAKAPDAVGCSQTQLRVACESTNESRDGVSLSDDLEMVVIKAQRFQLGARLLALPIGRI